MKIAFLGDIALLGQFDITKNKNIRESISCLKSLLKDYDYIVANLESPLTNRRKSLVCKSMHLRSDEDNVQILKMLGVNLVSLANNHIYDYGRKGLEDTISALEKNGIEWYGVDGKTVTKENKDGKIVFSGFCCYSTNGVGYATIGQGLNVLTEKNVLAQLRNDMDNEAYSVLSLHFGIEHTNYPACEHIDLMKKIIKTKSVIIHGHHPHVVQGIQTGDNSIIAYSLGNALFDSSESINGRIKLELNEDNRESFVLGVDLKKNCIVNHEIHGFYITDNGIVEHDIESEIRNISEKIGCIADKKQYELMRQEQYKKTVEDKFGKKDFKWMLSRVNYYSIGAKLATFSNKRKYEKEIKRFMED